MVLKIAALAPGYRKEHRSGCQGGDFQDHGSEGVQTMVPDHGFARVGTMQVQTIMPPLTLRLLFGHGEVLWPPEITAVAAMITELIRFEPEVCSCN